MLAPPNSPARPDSIKIGAGMFSKSLLFDADLVQLKAEREAAQQSCEPGEHHNITPCIVPVGPASLTTSHCKIPPDHKLTSYCRPGEPCNVTL